MFFGWFNAVFSIVFPLIFFGLIHVQQLLLPSFMCQGAQHLLLYHVPSPKTIAFLTKDTHKNFPP